MINGKDAHLHCLRLSNSDSTTTQLNKQAIPQGVNPKVGYPQEFTTIRGNYTSDGVMEAENLSSPEFCKTRLIPKFTLHIFNSPTSRYNIIIGRDILPCVL